MGLAKTVAPSFKNLPDTYPDPQLSFHPYPKGVLIQSLQTQDTLGFFRSIAERNLNQISKKGEAN